MEFGFTNPVLVDEKGGIIAGHCRVLAAKELNYSEVPTIELKGLSEAQRKAYIIADNQLALNAGWDYESLIFEIDSLIELGVDIELTGFTQEDLDSFKFDGDFGPGTEDEQGQLDELDPKYVDCPHCGKEFDLRQHG